MSNILTSCEPRPLEETDPYLAEQIRQIANETHPTIRGYSRTRMTSTYYMKSGRVKRFDYSVGRNEPCPCGSGKKFKKCCLK